MSPTAPVRRRHPKLEVLPGGDDPLDILPLLLGLTGERLDVDDPLAFLAGDLRPIVRIGRVGQVLVLVELIPHRVEKVVNLDALLAGLDVPGRGRRRLARRAPRVVPACGSADVGRLRSLGARFAILSGATSSGAPSRPWWSGSSPPAAAVQARRAPHPTCPLLHPPTGREPLDADALSADSRAHRATRGASDVIEPLLKAESGVDGRRRECPHGGQSRAADPRQM